MGPVRGHFMSYFKSLLVPLASILIAATAGPTVSDIRIAPRGAATENILTRPLWDDGKAEFAIYTGTTLRYGQLRPTEARIIVVKEDLLRSTLVKSDAGPIRGRTLEAIKLNFVADFLTGTYSYHQIATVMFDRASGDVLKETMSHTESCGITFVRIGPKSGRLTHEAHSYWDGEADREVAVEWPPGDRLYWDALPVSLRQWVAGGSRPFEKKVWLMPSQISGRSEISNTKPVSATLRMSSAGTIAIPAGRFAARKFEIKRISGSDFFWFDESFPHVMLKMETHAGRKLELRKVLRLDYWNHHMNGDERLLE